MVSLEECKSLMQRIYNLSINIEELKKQGFQDKDIEVYTEFVRKMDPEVAKQVERMKKLINYTPKL